MSTGEKQLSYCASIVKERDHDRWLRALFVPQPQREALLALLALAAELAAIRHAVREEMLGHVRHAWWREAVDEIYAGKPPRGQPVLQELAAAIQTGHLTKDTLLPMMECFRESFPDHPPEIDAAVDAAAGALLLSFGAEGDKGWQRAGAVIAAHRKRWGRRANPWLTIKLLVEGF